MFPRGPAHHEDRRLDLVAWRKHVERSDVVVAAHDVRGRLGSAGDLERARGRALHLRDPLVVTARAHGPGIIEADEELLVEVERVYSFERGHQPTLVARDHMP